MKKLNLMLGLILAFFALQFVGCSEISLYEVDAPDDLQSKIDEIAKEREKANSGDTTRLVINTAIAGNEDFSSGWWGAFSDNFKIPSGKCLHLEFVNRSSRANNWSNWNLAVTTADAHSTDDDASYAEYFVLRSDAYGWGNADYASSLINTDYFEEGHLSGWDEFRENYMDGAYVTMEIDHASAGYAYVTAVSNNASFGYAITETYNHPVSSTADIYACLITDNSYFVMKDAYLIPSKIKEIPDEEPVSLSVSGTPAALEISDEEFTVEQYWGNAVATVKFADGSSAECDVNDLSFSVPDLSTLGTKTIVVSYSKTKQGNFSKSVATYYTLEVTNPIVAIETSATAYTIGNAKFITLTPGTPQVTATYQDGSKALLAGSQYTVEFTDGKVVYPGTAATYENAYTVTFVTATGKEITAQGTLTVAQSSLEAQTTQVGATDFSTGWWVPEGFSRDWKIAAGESQTVSMYVGSDNLGNWHSPCTVLRRADLTEFGVVRMDSFGWGDGYASAVSSSAWNWDTFMSNINGSTVAITVSNNGDNTADIRYYVVWADGSEHYQYYDGFAVDSSDLNFAIVTEESYLIFD